MAHQSILEYRAQPCYMAHASLERGWEKMELGHQLSPHTGPQSGPSATECSSKQIALHCMELQEECCLLEAESLSKCPLGCLQLCTTPTAGICICCIDEAPVSASEPMELWRSEQGSFLTCTSVRGLFTEVKLQSQSLRGCPGVIESRFWLAESLLQEMRYELEEARANS